MHDRTEGKHFAAVSARDGPADSQRQFSASVGPPHGGLPGRRLRTPRGGSTNRSGYYLGTPDAFQFVYSARSAFDELTDKWGHRYPALLRLWDNAWAELIRFLD